MSFEAPRFQQTELRPLNDLQRWALQLAMRLTGIPILEGVLTDTVSLPAATSVDIDHRLGRDYRGWILVDVTYPGAQSPVYAQTSPNASTTLRLRCANAATVRVWVF